MTRLRRAVSHSLLSSIAVGGFNFVAQLWYARHLGVSAISEYAVAFVATQVVTLLCAFGVNQSAISLGADDATAKAAWAFQVRLTLLILAACALAIGLTFVGHAHQFQQTTLLACISISGYAVGLLGHIANIRRELRLEYGFVSGVRAGSYLAANLLGIAASLTTVSPIVLAIRDLANGLLFTLIALGGSGTFGMLLLRTNPFRSAGPAAPILMRVTVRNWAVSLSGAGVVRIDYWLAAGLLGKAGLGVYYQMRALIDGSLTVILGTIQSVVFSYLSRYSTTLQRRWLNYIVAGTACLALVAMAATMAFAPPLVALALGPQWKSATPLLVGLSAYAIFRGLFEVLTALAKATGRQHHILVAQVGWATTLALLMPLLTHKLGMLGSGLASAAGAVIGTALALTSMKFAPVLKSQR